MFAASFWPNSFWQRKFWPKTGLVPTPAHSKPYWGNFWSKSYFQVQYWPGSGALPAPFVPPPPPPVTAPPPPFTVPDIFQPPLTYDWVRSVLRSSTLRFVSYNARSQVMTLSYVGGGSDTFVGVGGDVAESLTAASSPDSFVGTYVYGKFGRQ
jgi:hypothetical protein